MRFAQIPTGCRFSPVRRVDDLDPVEGGDDIGNPMPFGANFLRGKLIAAIGPAPVDIGPMEHWLRRWGARYEAFPIAEKADFFNWDFAGQDFVLLFDFAPSSELSVTWLAGQIRKVDTEIPIIWISASHAFSDFSTRQFPVCDATLKLPFNEVEAALAFGAASTNNLFLFDARPELKHARIPRRPEHENHEAFTEEPAFAPGWWILPSALLGSLIWFWIFGWLL